MPLYKVDCSESVEEALARLDLESKQNKLAKLAAAEKAKAEKLQKTTKSPVTSSTEAVSEDPMSPEMEKMMEVQYPGNEKARALYPERGGEKFKASWFDVLVKGEGREGLDKMKCEQKVWDIVNESKGFKLYKYRLLPEK